MGTGPSSGKRSGSKSSGRSHTADREAAKQAVQVGWNDTGEGAKGAVQRKALQLKVVGVLPHCGWQANRLRLVQAGCHSGSRRD